MTSGVSLVLTSDSRNDLMKRVTIALRFFDTSISFELFVDMTSHSIRTPPGGTLLTHDTESFSYIYIPDKLSVLIL